MTNLETHIRIRTTPEQKKRIKKLAEERGMTISEFIRYLVFKLN